MAASALGYYFFSGIRAFGFIYFTEHYGVSRAMLGGLIVIVGIGGLAGVFFGGQLSERLLKRGHAAARIVLPGVAMILAVGCFAPAIWTTSVYFGIGMLTLAATFLAAANPAIDAARLDIIVPNLWGGRKPAAWPCAAPSKVRRRSSSASPPSGSAAAKRPEVDVPHHARPADHRCRAGDPGRRTYPPDVATAGASADEIARKRKT